MADVSNESRSGIGVEQTYSHNRISACNSAVVLAKVFYESDCLDDTREAISNRLRMLRFSTPSLILAVLGQRCALTNTRAFQTSPSQADELSTE